MSTPNDPPRLSSEAPEFMKEALAMAKLDQPSADRLLALKAKVSAAAAGAAGGGVGAGVATSAKTAAWVKVAIAVASASVLAVTGVSLNRSGSPADETKSSASPASAAPLAPAPSFIVAPIVATEDATAQVAPARPTATPGPVTSAAAKTQTSDLNEETRLLTLAQRALASNPAEALRVCETHRKEFPHGILSQERDAVVVEALVQAGRKAEAKRAAAAFARNYPGSSHLRRITDLVAD